MRDRRKKNEEKPASFAGMKHNHGQAKQLIAEISEGQGFTRGW